MNHSREIGLAMIGFDAGKQRLPGWRNQLPGTNGSNGLTVEWPTVLLPYIERKDIYNAWANLTSVPGDTANISPVIPIFKCPTSPSDDDNTANLVYGGNAGSGLEAVFGSSNVAQPKGDGVFLDNVGGTAYLPARLNLDVITGADGTSNTLLLAERCGSGITSQTSPYGVQASVEPGASAATAWTMAVASPAVFLQPPVDAANETALDTAVLGTNAKRVINPAADFYRYPSSNHPGGIMVTFCDGHTGFMADSLLPHVYAQLMTSNSQSNTTPPMSARVLAWGLQPLNANDFAN